MSKFTIDDFLNLSRCSRLFFMDHCDANSPSYVPFLEVSELEYTHLLTLASSYLSPSGFQQQLTPFTALNFVFTPHFIRIHPKHPLCIDIVLVKPCMSPRKTHFFESSLYLILLKHLGYHVRSFDLLYLNGGYHRYGELDLSKLFLSTSLIQEAQNLSEQTHLMIQTLTDISTCNTPTEPFLARHCLKPDPCSYFSSCFPQLSESSILTLSDLPFKDKLLFYHQGITQSKDLPNLLPMSPSQHIQLECEKTGKPFIDYEKVSAFLSSLTYPLSFLDFEATQLAVPLFESLRPFESVSLQFSLHSQESPKAPLSHYGFVAPLDQSPFLPLCEAFLSHISDSGSIVSFNDTLEKQTLRLWAALFPQYHDRLLDISDRIVDLGNLFHQFSYYHPAMQGKRSLKAVALALCPELSDPRDSLSNGREAALAFSALFFGDSETYASTLKKLCDYSYRDTLMIAYILFQLQKDCFMSSDLNM